MISQWGSHGREGGTVTIYICVEKQQSDLTIGSTVPIGSEFWLSHMKKFVLDSKAANEQNNINKFSL